MKDVKVTIAPTNIKTLKFENNYNAKPGEQVKLGVQMKVAVHLNPAAPTTALAHVHFAVTDEEKKHVSMELETLTPITVSTFIDNLDEVVKSKYMNDIMLAVNEKIRMTTSMLGLGIQVPAITLPYRETNEAQDGSLDSEIFTKL
ncbi:MAG: hypothetical protein IJM34_07260 [Lachnospiraceae bacterium]|nr:hypothetical protein [Lachnospiraceae bacterium]